MLDTKLNRFDSLQIRMLDTNLNQEEMTKAARGEAVKFAWIKFARREEMTMTQINKFEVNEIDKAIEMSQKMQRLNHGFPTTSSYTPIIHPLCEAGRVKESCDSLVQLVESGSIPREYTYRLVCDLLNSEEPKGQLLLINGKTADEVCRILERVLLNLCEEPSLSRTIIDEISELKKEVKPVPVTPDATPALTVAPLLVKTKMQQLAELESVREITDILDAVGNTTKLPPKVLLLDMRLSCIFSPIQRLYG